MKVGIRDFLKSATSLFKGAVFAQFITILSIPILTRLYTETEFGLYSIFLSFCGVLSTIILLRLDIAILNVNSEVWQKRTLIMVFKVGTSICLLLSCVIALLYKPLERFLKLPLELLLLAPTAALLLSAFNFYINLSVKKRDFSGVNKTRILRTINLSAVQIFTAPLSFGLIFGEMMSRFIAIVTLRNRFNDYSPSQNVEISLFRFFRFYKKYITYSVFSGVLNTFTMHLPTFFLGYNYGLSAAGAYLIAIRIASLPSVFLGQTLSQLLTAQIDRITSRKKFLFKILYINSFACITIFFIAFLVMAFWGEFILGKSWQVSVSFFNILIPLYLSQMIAQPFNNLLNNQGRQKNYAIWDASRLLSILLLCLYIIKSDQSAEVFLFGLSFTMSLFYFIMLGLVFRGEVSET